MPKLLQKLVFSFLVFLITFISVAPNFMIAKGQAWYSQEPIEWYLKVYDKDASPPNEIFGERYTAAQVQWVVWSFLFLPIRIIESVVGEDAITCVIKLVGTGTLDVGDCIGGVKTQLAKIFNGIFPNIIAYNNKPFIAQVFDTGNRGISGIEYTKNLLKKFSPVTEVRAQGIGYPGLSWIQQYWTGFRNISYGLLVLVIIVFAFMIMFRVKLSPQTVVSVQSALPKVIVTMILVTFSYAIAGFAIDLMYVVSGLFALLITSAGFADDLPRVFGTISGTGPGFSTPIGGFWILFMMLGYAVMFFFSSLVSVFTAFLTGFNLFGAVLGIILMILGVLCLLIMLWYTVKVPFVLFKTLVSVYLSVITAPVQILAGAIIPSMGFGAWFKKLMSDILVFPVVGLLVWFAWHTLMASFKESIIDFGLAWGTAASFTPKSWIPGIVGGQGVGEGGISGIIFLAISFSLVTLIPKVPDMLKGMLLGEKFAFGTDIGEMVTGGLGYLSAYSKNKDSLKEGWGGMWNKIHPEKPATPATPIDTDKKPRYS